MDGWAMDGEWLDGMVSGREAEGKKKTDQGWAIGLGLRPKAKVKYQGCGLVPGSMEDDSWCPRAGKLWQRTRPDAMALALCQASPRRRATRNAPLGACEGVLGGGDCGVGRRAAVTGGGQQCVCA